MARRKSGGKTLKIIPLGGLEQIGMNITAFEYGNSIVVVDCGLSFPEDNMLGIDLVIPDLTYLQDNADKVEAIVITHGHEDHIGALPYVLKELNVPVYATRLTTALIEGKLKEHGLLDVVSRNVVSAGDVITLGAFKVEFIRTNHSIADACALAITSPAGTVVHTGDCKVDYTPVFGDAIDLQRFAELGRKGVLALMCDSTNAERPGFTNSEKTVLAILPEMVPFSMRPTSSPSCPGENFRFGSPRDAGMVAPPSPVRASRSTSVIIQFATSFGFGEAAAAASNQSATGFSAQSTCAS